MDRCTVSGIFLGRVGGEVGTYTLRERLAQGVWKATATGDEEKEVCLKVARAGEDYEDCWRHETAVLRRTGGNDHVVRLLGEFEHGPHRCVALEWAELDLFRFIHGSPRMELGHVLDLTAQLLGALAFLHGGMPDGWRVVHTDIKPENLLVDAAGRRLRVADFDSSSILHGADPDLLGPGNQHVMPHGHTTDYRALEMICPPIDVTPAADVWSAGCVVYDMLSGGDCLFEPPNDGESEEADSSESESSSPDTSSESSDSECSEYLPESEGEEEEEEEAEVSIDLNVLQLLVVRETLGPWPAAFTRRNPAVFTRSGALKFDLLRRCTGLPADLVDAEPGSQPVAARLVACGVDEGVARRVARDLIGPMLEMDHRRRPAAAEVAARLARAQLDVVDPAPDRAEAPETALEGPDGGRCAPDTAGEPVVGLMLAHGC
jgi:serine/threonine protein kinase